MDFFVSIAEQGLIYGILALGVYITYKIRDFPDFRGGDHCGIYYTGDETIPYACAFFSGRSTGGNLYGTHPCKMQGKGSAVGYHYDDGAVDDQPLYCRDSECAAVFSGDDI